MAATGHRAIALVIAILFAAGGIGSAILYVCEALPLPHGGVVPVELGIAVVMVGAIGVVAGLVMTGFGYRGSLWQFALGCTIVILWSGSLMVFAMDVLRDGLSYVRLFVDQLCLMVFGTGR